MATLKSRFPLQEDRRFPFYALVPKEFRANLRFRQRALELGERDEAFRDQFREMCRLDILFWINTFGWIEEPRDSRSIYRILPFITRAMQDRGFLQLKEAIPLRDVCAYKSREVGFSWMALYRATHDLLFNEGAKVGLVSAKEDLVDSRGDTSALMPKIDFILHEKRMPWWLMPSVKMTRNDMLFWNPENESSIVGYACTDDVGRGGRKLYFFADEIDFWPTNQIVPALSAMMGNTHCRVVCSTPNNPGGAYHQWVTEHEARQIELIDLYWQEDPEKRAGLYTSENGRVKIIDREFWSEVLECKPAELEKRIEKQGCSYRFECDGKTRSPYMDAALLRSENPREAHREFERLFEGRGGMYFTKEVFDRHRDKFCIPPVRRGQFSFDVDTGEVARWHEEPIAGSVRIWIEFLSNPDNPSLGIMVPRSRRYVLGADVAAGTGGSHSSNSVAVVADADTGEQVLEFATGNMRPDRFARWCAGVARFFNNALLIWDAHGATGSSFTKAIIEDCGYRNLYKQKVKDTISERSTEKVGFRAVTEETIQAFLDSFETAIETGRYILRSEHTFDEVPQYVWLANGKVGHSTSVMTDDPTAMAKSHGDRVIGNAVAWEGIKRMTGGRPRGKPDAVQRRGPVPGTVSWRLAEALRESTNASIYDF